MIDRINIILKSIFISWIILFGLISNHPECSTIISDICLKKNLPLELHQALVSATKTIALASESGCKDGVCCEEEKCNDEDKVFISGQYPDKIKHVLGIGNKIVFTEKNPKQLSKDFYKYKITKTKPIYILIQSFLC